MERVGKYVLLRRIAVGGMAEIYIARETGIAGFERPAIVKRILPALANDDGFVELFLDEARLAARLSHPKIVHIYELGQDEDSYYIAMEFIPGCDLESLLVAEPGPVPLGDALHVIGEVLEGLHYAHALVDHSGVPLGVVHRDVAPKNVLVSLDGAVKIVDFGIAKARTKATVTAPGLVMGTYSYMSPEQACGRPVDRRADVFAAGAMLYRMVTGLNAYRSEGMALVEDVRTASFRAPRLENPSVPPSVERIILQAMRADVEERYPTAAHMRRDVVAAIRDHGLAADAEGLASLLEKRLPHLRQIVSSWLADGERGRGSEADATLPSRREGSSVAARLRALGSAPPRAADATGPSAEWSGVDETADGSDPDAPTAAVDLQALGLVQRSVDWSEDIALLGPADEVDDWPPRTDSGYGLDEPATIMEAPRFPTYPHATGGPDATESLDLGAPGVVDEPLSLELPEDVALELEGRAPSPDGAGEEIEGAEIDLVTQVSSPPDRAGRRR